MSNGRSPATNVSAEAYANAVNRLRINFRVAVYSNLLAVLILLVSACGMIALLLAGEPITAAVPAAIGVLDIAWGVAERPWRQLLLANNRIALSDSLWVSYLETKDAVLASGLSGEGQLVEIRRAQNLWVSRIGAIAQEDYAEAFKALWTINDRSEAVLRDLFSDVQIVGSALQSVETGGDAQSAQGFRIDDVINEGGGTPFSGRGGDSSQASTTGPAANSADRRQDSDEPGS